MKIFTPNVAQRLEIAAAVPQPGHPGPRPEQDLPREAKFTVEVDARARPKVTRHNLTPHDAPPHLLQHVDELRALLVQLDTASRRRHPLHAGLRLLNVLPETNFAGGQRGLRAAAAVLADWTVFAVGLGLGLCLLPTGWPISRAICGYRTVQQLRRGLEDVALAEALYHETRHAAFGRPVDAQNVLDVYRAQACVSALLSVQHRSPWSAAIEQELLHHLDQQRPGFRLQTMAQDARRNAQAKKLRMAAAALTSHDDPRVVRQLSMMGVLYA